MKNYLSKTKGSSYRSKYSVRRKVIAVLVVFLVLVWFKPIFGWVGAVVTSPIHFVTSYFEESSAIIPSYVRERRALIDEIQELKDEAASQQGSLLSYKYLEEENQELRGLLGVSTTELHTAGVIASPPYSPYDSFVIDRGTGSGIEVGAPVYYGSGLALGYIRAVYANHSLVTSFTSPNVETTVYIFGPDIFTTAYGEGGGVLRISVPQGIVVEKGDLVALPSLDGGILGEVDIIQSIPTEPEQHAYVTLQIPLRSIRLVSVGKNVLESTSFENALANIEELEDTLFAIDIPENYQLATSTTEVSTSTDED